MKAASNLVKNYKYLTRKLEFHRHFLDVVEFLFDTDGCAEFEISAILARSEIEYGLGS